MPHFQQLLSTRNLLMLRFVSALFSPPPLLLVLLFLLFFFFSVFFNCGWLFVYCDWSPENNVTVLACSEAGKQRPAIITTIIRNKKNAPQTSATYPTTLPPPPPPICLPSATMCSSHVHLIVLRGKHFAVRQRPSWLSALSDICTLWKSAFVFHAKCSRSRMFSHLLTDHLPHFLTPSASGRSTKAKECLLFRSTRQLRPSMSIPLISQVLATSTSA